MTVSAENEDTQLKKKMSLDSPSVEFWRVLNVLRDISTIPLFKILILL